MVHVTAVATAAATAGFGLKVMLEPYRQEGKEIVGRVTDNTSYGYCYPRFEHADTLASKASSDEGILSLSLPYSGLYGESL